MEEAIKNEIYQIYANNIGINIGQDSSLKETAIGYLRQNNLSVETYPYNKFIKNIELTNKKLNEIKQERNIRGALKKSLEVLKKIAWYRCFEILENTQMKIDHIERLRIFRNLIQMSSLYESWEIQELNHFFDDAYAIFSNGLYFLSFNKKFNTGEFEFSKELKQLFKPEENIIPLFAAGLYRRLIKKQIIGFHSALWSPTTPEITSKYLLLVFTQQVFDANACNGKDEYHFFRGAFCYAYFFGEEPRDLGQENMNWYRRVRNEGIFQHFATFQDTERLYSDAIEEITEQLEQDTKAIISPNLEEEINPPNIDLNNITQILKDIKTIEKTNKRHNIFKEILHIYLNYIEAKIGTSEMNQIEMNINSNNNSKFSKACEDLYNFYQKIRNR